MTAANKNQAFQKYIKEEKDRTISELTYWKDMNERLYDSFSNNEKLLQEAREEAEFLKSMQDAWKLQIQELTLQLATQKADMAQERFALTDQVESLLRRNSHLVEEQTKLTITKDEFREQAEQASERIQQLEYKVDTLTAQRKSIGSVETKRKELQDSLNELQARYESLSAHYKDSLDEMKEERLQFKNTYDSLMEEHKDVTKNFLKARNLINNNAALFVASEMSRQAKVLLDETAKVADTSIPAVPPELVIDNPPPRDDDASDAAEEKKLDDQATLPLSVEGVDSMLSFESTKVGTQADDDDESGMSSHESDDDTAEDSRSLNRAELWFWGLLDSNQSKSMEEDGKQLSPSSRRSKIEKSKRPKSKNELKFL
jgi:chromosome segregation ATPase